MTPSWLKSPHVLFHRDLQFFSWSRTRPRRDSGVAYLMVMILALTIIILSQVELQNIVTLSRGEREKDMIWRGQQYARAIRLYYTKSGHYPHDIDDLEQGLPELHFLRLAAYKDPMNTGDGSWRFIYVSQTGQIIGSVKYATLQQMALLDLNGGQLPAAVPGTLGVPASTLASGSGSGDATSPSNSSSTTSPPTTPSTIPGDNSSSQISTTGPTSTPPASAAASSQTSAIADNPLAALKPTGPVDGPVLGAFLTGVGSKVDRASVKIYKGGKNYNQWEFIWNPLEDQARAAQRGLSPQGQVPGMPGLPIGAVPGAATNPAGPSGTPAPATPGSQQPPPDQSAPQQ